MKHPISARRAVKPQRPLTPLFFLMLSICLPLQPAVAEQRLDLEGTAIFGNKESPNILYVVPWRKPEGIPPMQPPGMGNMDDLLAPLDRDVFRRRLEWHQTFQQKP